MGERRVDDEGYVWEKSGWSGDWKPVRDNWGNQVREGGGTWWGNGGREERDEGGGCFVATACVGSRGLPDDCEELRLMRGFRDGYVAALPGGEALIKEYYEKAPRIVEAINGREDRTLVYEELYSRWLAACLDLIAAGEEERALEHCADVLNGLAREYLDRPGDSVTRRPGLALTGHHQPSEGK